MTNECVCGPLVAAQLAERLGCKLMLRTSVQQLTSVRCGSHEVRAVKVESGRPSRTFESLRLRTVPA